MCPNYDVILFLAHEALRFTPSCSFAGDSGLSVSMSRLSRGPSSEIDDGQRGATSAGLLSSVRHSCAVHSISGLVESLRLSCGHRIPEKSAHFA